MILHALLAETHLRLTVAMVMSQQYAGMDVPIQIRIFLRG